MTTDARLLLENIIADFAPEKFSQFFREKSRQFADKQEDLIHYKDADFTNGKKQGEIKFPNGNELLVCTFAVQQPLSERSGKKAQYEKAKKILKDRQRYSAGIFIFSDASGNFRFSLVYPESTGAKRQWNNFRRFTYFVSADPAVTNKTYLQRIGDGDFSTLQKIKEAFSVEKVTKEFYEAIAHWYFWTLDHSRFPKDAEAEDNGRNISVIRLITRIIFIWFMRERGLVPKALFDEKSISTIIKDTSPSESTYYKAILQNLFFATLSTKKAERQLRSETRGYKGYNPDFGNQYVYRYHELFRQPDKIKDYFAEIPFLNGGLFECLDDKPNDIYIDGFTATKKNQPEIPNLLFFSAEKPIDLNKYFGTKDKKYKVSGLFDILSSFNFTIDENTADDQDVALDPELLGRVFENLLASFNPETATTARKATGSYYTPRQIVDYMVQESLKAYFKTHLSGIADMDIKLEQLFSAGSVENPFNSEESKTIVNLIESVNIVDPAVGSGAFPMGALNKLVFILNKVDAGNELWKQAQLAVVEAMPDSSLRRETRNRIEEFFKGKNADYGRKLYLIQKCIYGVDIQQIAVEIAKLRFFISLLVDEKIDKTKDNWGIEPLPNLDFKIMQGNSLISSFMGIDFDNGEDKQDDQNQAGLAFIDEDDALIKTFEQKKIDFQSESAADKKGKLKKEIEDLLIEIFETKIKKQKAEYFKEIAAIERRNSVLPNKQTREEMIAKEKQKLSQRMNFDLAGIEKQLREFTSKKKTRPFFPWKLYFAEVFEKGGFDVVIGNPPYIEFKKLPAEEKSKFSNYISAKGKYDIYVIFDERSNSLLKSDGVLCFIQPTTFMKKDFGEAIRKFIRQNFKIKIIFDFADIQVFEGATNYTGVFLFSKSILPKSYKFDYHQYLNTGKSISIADFQNSLCDNNTSSIKNFLEIKDGELEKTEWNFQNDSTNTLLSKFSVNTKPLSEITESIFQGIASGKDEVFYVNDDTIKKFKIEKGILKKLLKGKDIKKYVIHWAGYYVVYPYDKNSQVLSEATLKNEYPNAFAYLKEFREMLKGRDYFDNSPKKWFELWNQRSFENFKTNRIISPEITDKNNFVLSNSFYGNTKTYHIIPKDKSIDNYYYLLGLLNSRLLDFIYKKITAPQAGGFYAYKTQFLSKLPIREVTQPKPYAEIVSKILKAKEENPKADTTTLEKKLDEMVYKLYELTEDEIKIVGGNGAKQ